MVVYLMTSLLGEQAESPALSDRNIDHNRLACPSARRRIASVKGSSS